MEPPRSRPGPTLEERSRAAEVGSVRSGKGVVPRPAARHCWVISPDVPASSWPGLLVEWRRDAAGAWLGRVAYVVDDDGTSVLVETWVPAAALAPAGPGRTAGPGDSHSSG